MEMKDPFFITQLVFNLAEVPHIILACLVSTVPGRYSNPGPLSLEADLVLIRSDMCHLVLTLGGKYDSINFSLEDSVFLLRTVLKTLQGRGTWRLLGGPNFAIC